MFKLSTEPQNNTGLKGRPVEELIKRFYGTLDRWPMEADGTKNWTQPQIIAICEHMSKTGDCLWHSQAIVMNAAMCNCRACEALNTTGPLPKRRVQ